MRIRRALACGAVLAATLATSAAPALAADPAPTGRGVAAATGADVELPVLPLAVLVLSGGLVAATVAGHRSYDGS